jgi:23S rRNA (cytosine1962-C5)-methyltransferase
LSQYELIDFGHGRKLESLCGYLVDRPSVAASNAEAACDRRQWQAADAVYLASEQRWEFRRSWPAEIALRAGPFSLPFRATPFGHIGCFPEQLPHWRWLAEQVSQLATVTDAVAPRGLNLFAHTGGSTLAMAAAGASVTHLDAAKPSVTAARQAAAQSGLSAAPIRYLVEDAPRYVSRELRRGQCYDLVVLDPPSYGHAPGGKTWRIQRDLWPLVDQSLRLLGGARSAMLITGHSVDVDQQQVGEYLRRQIGSGRRGSGLQLQMGRSELVDRAGRCLDAGFYVRAAWHSAGQ